MRTRARARRTKEERLAMYQVQFAKTVMCRFNMMGSCKMGAACHFAHTAEEIQEAPDLRKTVLCVKWKHRSCRREACPFAHGKEELRPIPAYRDTFEQSVVDSQKHPRKSSSFTESTVASVGEQQQALRSSPSASSDDEEQNNPYAEMPAFIHVDPIPIQNSRSLASHGMFGQSSASCRVSFDAPPAWQNYSPVDQPPEQVFSETPQNVFPSACAAPTVELDPRSASPPTTTLTPYSLPPGAVPTQAGLLAQSPAMNEQRSPIREPALESTPDLLSTSGGCAASPAAEAAFASAVGRLAFQAMLEAQQRAAVYENQALEQRNFAQGVKRQIWLSDALRAAAADLGASAQTGRVVTSHEQSPSSGFTLRI